MFGTLANYVWYGGEPRLVRRHSMFGTLAHHLYFAPVLVFSPKRFFFYSQSPRSANGLASENSAGGDFG